MATGFTVKVTGVAEFVNALERITPSKNRAWVHTALKKAAFEVQALARTKYILRGGRFFKPGTKTLKAAAVDPHRLTSRTGRLRDSIAVDMTPSPRHVFIGTDVIYGAVHELGGRFHRPRPFLQPALAEAARGFQALFQREWERQIP